MNRPRILVVLLAAVAALPPMAVAQNPFDQVPPAAAPTVDGFQALAPQMMRDPMFDNMEAYEMLVPQGWRVNGGVQWDMQKVHYAQLVMSMIGPAGEEVQFLPAKPYTYTELEFFPPPQVPGMPPMAPPPAPQLPAIGSTDATGTTFAPLPQSTEAYVLEHYLPHHRPLARNVRILEVQEMPEMRQALEQLFGPIIAQGRQTAQQMQQLAAMSGGQYGEDSGIIADLFRVEYEENGVTYTELLPVTGYYQQTQMLMTQSVLDQWGNMATVPGSRHLNQSWWISDGKSFRAPSAAYGQAEPVMVTAALSVRQTPAYATARLQLDREIMEMRQRQHAATMAAIRERGRIMRQTQQEIFDMHQDSYRRQQEARDRQHENFIAYIRDEQISKGPDGKRFVHPVGSQLFQGPGGQIGYGPQGSEPPSGWTPYGG